MRHIKPLTLSFALLVGLALALPGAVAWAQTPTSVMVKAGRSVEVMVPAGVTGFSSGDSGVATARVTAPGRARISGHRAGETVISAAGASLSIRVRVKP